MTTAQPGQPTSRAVITSSVTGWSTSGQAPDLPAALRRHVEVLASAPRNRNADPDHLAQAQRYVGEQLHLAGWTVTEQTFSTPAGLGVSDAGYPLGHLWPLRVRGRVPGVN